MPAVSSSFHILAGRNTGGEIMNVPLQQAGGPDGAKTIKSAWLLAALIMTFAIANALTNAAAKTTLTTLNDVEYRTGNTAWRLDYAAPANPAAPLPALVLIHGGSWFMLDKSDLDSLIQDWAQLGFFAMTINYRLASSTDKAFPEALEDCKCSVRWLRAHAAELHVDKNRIGVYGFSAGGHLGMLMAMLSKKAGYNNEGDGPWQEESSDIDAVASDAGVVSLDASLPGNSPLALRFAWFLGGSNETPPPNLVVASSPASYVGRAPSLPPFLLLHGTLDDQVPVGLTDDFVAALRERGMPDLTYLRYEGVGHCPFLYGQAPGSRAAVENFLLRTVKNKSAGVRESHLLYR